MSDDLHVPKRRSCDGYAAGDGHLTPCDNLKERMELDMHIFEQLNEIRASLNNAFVGGDVNQHREDHQAMINAKRAEEDFWKELRLDLAKKSLWGLLLLLLGFAMLGVAAKLGIGAK